MINFDDIKREKIKEHNPNWLQIPDCPYRILIIGGSGSGKMYVLPNLKNLILMKFIYMLRIHLKQDTSC